MSISICLLGLLEVWTDGVRRRLGVRQQRLLALLALRRGRIVDTDALIDTLWDGEPPRSARRQVPTAVWQLRQALAGAGAAITSEPGGYRLALDAECVDVCRFESLVGQARRLANTEPARASALLREALALWRGAALTGLTGKVFDREACRLNELRLTATEDSFELDLSLGMHPPLVDELAGLVTEHPTRERLVAAFMLALYRSGRAAEAIGAYQATATLLRDQLGVDPSDALRDRYVKILRADPALAAPAADIDEPVSTTENPFEPLIVLVNGPAEIQAAAKAVQRAYLANAIQRAYLATRGHPDAACDHCGRRAKR